MLFVSDKIWFKLDSVIQQWFNLTTVIHVRPLHDINNQPINVPTAGTQAFVMDNI
jgi:hypothetical protein